MQYLLFSFFFYALNVAQADCDGTTKSFGTDCVHFHDRATESFEGLFATRARACERAHQRLDQTLRIWGDTHCLQGSWRLSREPELRTCEYVGSRASAVRGVRCTQGANLALTESIISAQCRNLTVSQFTSVRELDGSLRLFINYNTPYRMLAENIGACTGDVRVAAQRCSFVFRNFTVPQTDCYCDRGACELRERINAKTAASRDLEANPGAEVSP